MYSDYMNIAVDIGNTRNGVLGDAELACMIDKVLKPVGAFREETLTYKRLLLSNRSDASAMTKAGPSRATKQVRATPPKTVDQQECLSLHHLLYALIREKSRHTCRYTWR